ncbi:uncharacterized protein LOC134261576 [Saccostrea cucullata]|uniref:uncharacterized protein LOC134261576 n=1 Tax=Saccostrea cuccullata TaxID=36930 RepID=UPI002ED5E2A0
MEFDRCLFNPEDEISLPEFYQKYRQCLPMLVVVVGGHNGTTEFDDTPSDTIIRYNKFQSVKRALAQDPKTRRNYISIPVNAKYKFNVIKSISTKNKADHTLAEILDTYPLPVLIQFSESQEIPSEGRNREGTPYQLLITHVYEEVFIQGNFITEGKITKHPSSFSLCPLISVAPIQGFTDRTKKEYDKYLKKLEGYVNKNTVFSESQCNLAIKILKPDADELKDVLQTYQNETTVSHPPPSIPVRGQSLKKARQEGDDDDGEDYEVMEQPMEEVDTYRVAAAAGTPSYVNDRLCQVKPLVAGQDDADDEEGDMYEPMENPDENTTPSKPVVISKPDETPPPPRPVEKPNVRSRSLPNTGAPTPKDTTPPARERGHSTSCADEPEHCKKPLVTNTTNAFDIEEKSIQDIGEVLCRLRLNKYVERFEEEMVDGEILAGLSVEDLQKEFNFSKLEAMRLFKYIEKGHIPK